MEDAPGFEALSYVWGDAGRVHSMQVGNSCIPVTANLLDALSYVRSRKETRTLWVDAVCINQDNLYERSHQVQQMRDIYAKALRVLIWLGPSTEHSEVGMKALEHLVRAKPFEEAPWRTLPPSLVVPGLKDIMQRSWFQRFWVVQEGAVAKELVMHCGPYQVSWLNRVAPVLRFMRSIKLAVTSPQWQDLGLHDINTDLLIGLLQTQLDGGPDATLWSQRSRGPDLLDFAYSMRYRQSSDVRDRIYALLGLANVSADDKIIPDYAKTVEEVYDEFARKVTKETERICELMNNFAIEPAIEPAGLSSIEITVSCAPQQEAEVQKHNIRSIAEQASAQALEKEEDHNIENFIEQASAQALVETRSRRFDDAARLLENAAMLLRGEKFHHSR